MSEMWKFSGGEVTMMEVTKYKCDYCHELFDSGELCLKHEESHRRLFKANEMLDAGKTLEEINNECHFWSKVPDYLKNVTKYNCFTISCWQYCSRPINIIVSITMDGKLKLYRRDIWSDSYVGELDINDEHLKDPRPKEELFIDPRHRDYYKTKGGRI